VQKQNTEHALMTEADTDRSLQLVLDQGHGTPIRSAAMLTNHVCIPCSATGGVNDVHRRQSRQAPSRVWAVEATLACCSGTTQDCTGCNASLYPNLSILLQVLVTWPVTTATPERSFSMLKRLKTYLRSSMGDERLTSLALIHVHAQTMPIEPVEVVDK